MRSSTVAGIRYFSLALALGTAALSGAGCSGGGSPAPIAPGTATPIPVGTSPAPASTPTPGPSPSASATTYPVTATTDVPYGPAAAEVLDAYVPSDGAAMRPAVIVVHGGESTSGDKSDLTNVSRSVAQAGFTVFNVDYTLSTPTVPGFPVQGDQVQAAIVWARANAATYGVDPARIGGLGSSHGAELIDLVALEGSGSQTTGARLKAAVSWSAPTDLVSLYAIECPGNGASCLSKGELQYFDCLYPDCPQTYVDASPVTYVDASDPPISIFNSTNELVPLAQANELASDLANAGVPYQLTVYVGTLHAQAYSSQALAPSIQFLRTELDR